MLNIKYILYFSVFVVRLTCYSQGNYTNIDSTILDVKWQTNYLNELQFQNGDYVTICTDNDSWRYNNMRNKAAVYMTPNNPNLYNFYALIDERNICPKYFKVPTELNFIDINIKTSTTANYTETGSSNFLYVHPVQWIDYSSGQVDFRNKKLIFPTILGTNSDRSQGDFDTPSEYYFNTVSIDEKRNFSIWREPKNGTGLPVKCITDRNAIIQDSVFDYRQLIWQKYTTTLQELLTGTLDYFEHKESFTIQLNATMQSNRNSAQAFRLSVSEFNVIGKTKNISEFLIEERLLGVLRSKIPIPTYKGTVLLAQSNMELTLNREIQRMSNQRFITAQIIRASISLSDPKINYANDHGFRVKTYKESISVADGNQTIYSKADLKVSSFHGRGSIYSIAAVLPGLGLKSVNRIEYKESGTKPWKKLSKTFLISSIGIGAVGVGSKIFSDFQYKKYKENPLGLSQQRNYELANVSNHVFISSLIGYGLLSVLDFSFTFGVGMKNKSTQTQLNKTLKNGDSYNLRADFTYEQIYAVSEVKETLKTSEKENHLDNSSSQAFLTRGEVSPTNQVQEKAKQLEIEITTNSFRDTRDGKVYKTVQIGSQVWMAENLAYKPKTGNFWAYDNNEINVKRYGYLYDWKTACEVCPEGWRLPSEKDWNALIKTIKLDQIKKEFSALPSGYFDISGNFFYLEHSGFWWSATHDGKIKGKAFCLERYVENSRIGDHNMFNGFSVRCIKN